MPKKALVPEDWDGLLAYCAAHVEEGVIDREADASPVSQALSQAVPAPVRKQD